MKRLSAIVTIAAVTSIAGCAVEDTAGRGQSGVAGPVELRGVDLREREAAGSAPAPTAARAYVLARGARLGLSARDELAVLRATRDASGTEHVRLQQTHGGRKVFGADVVAHVRDGVVLGVAGNLAANLALDGAPELDAAAAVATAKAAYAGKEPLDLLTFDRERVELVVLPNPQRGARLAWHVVFHTELQRGIRPGLWNTMIDARTGAVLRRWNAIHTLSQASGPGGNAKVPWTWTDALDVEPQGSAYAMDTARLKTTDMQHGQSGAGTVVVGPLAGIGDAAVNDAHGYAEITLAVMHDWYGYDSIDGSGFKIASRVHYGSSYENAFWDGEQMTYGDGAATFHPLSGALDVVGHEINHGFTSFHSDLTYSGQSGGINESFSDVAGAIAEWYLRPQSGNFDVGEDIFRAPNEALRYMCDPKKDGASIDDAADYTSWIDVHYSSGVFNKAFCLASRRLAGGGPQGIATQASVRRAGEAWYHANAHYWTSGTTFVQGCQGIVDAATALAFTAPEVAALRDSFADVGVACGGAPANQPPTVTLTSPSNGAVVAGTIDVTATAADVDGTVAKVTFTLPDGTVQEDTTAPFGVAFDTTTVPDGSSRTITARATDAAGGISAPSTVTVIVQNAAPGACASGAFGGAGLPLSIPDNDTAGVSSTAFVAGAGVTSTVRVSASVKHTWRGDLRITLVAPDGSSAVVFDRVGSSEDDVSLVDVAVPSLVGKVATGSWRLLVQDLAAADVGTLESWSVGLAATCDGGGGSPGHWSASATPSLALVDDGSACTTVEVATSGNAADVKLDLAGRHDWRAVLRATLAHGGVTVPAFALGAFPTGAGDFALNARPLAGFQGDAAGAWTLCVFDTDAYGDTGTLTSWSVHD